MNFQNNRYTLRFADSRDNDGIRSVFESSSFAGGLGVQYLRNPAPYESFEADGAEARILVVIDNATDITCGVGGAVIRMEYLNGVPEKCAYLTGLKIRPDYQRKLPFITKAYSLLHEAVADCRVCYTTVLDDNTAAVSLFEKQHRNMPTYRYLGHYTTYCFHGGKRLVRLEQNNTAGFDELMETHFRSMDLTPADYHCAGFGDQTFYCIRENDEITACCFVGNQQTFKQYKMCAYGGIYKFLSKLPTQLIGYPAFPKASSVIDHGVVSYLYVKDCDPKLCRKFLRSVAAEAGFSLLLWGGFENNPLCTALEQVRAIRYGSRLYEVVWEELQDSREAPGTALSAERIIGMEAALL